MSLHIHAPAPVLVCIRRMDCPTCKRSRFGLTTSYEWYGGDLTCLRCGERWNEDGRAERPFERAWRKRSVADARATAKRHGAKFAAPVCWRTETAEKPEGR